MSTGQEGRTSAKEGQESEKKHAEKHVVGREIQVSDNVFKGALILSALEIQEFLRPSNVLWILHFTG